MKHDLVHPTHLKRTWTSQFVIIKVLKEAVECYFSRSSGPGGQPHYVASTHSILITSMVHQSQSQNIDECLQKLHSLILTFASRCIKSALSDGQKKKVEALVKAEKSRRKMEKIQRSDF
ncbi:hypothetical protein BYT27DRAFT_7220425 [Phlegmacium glaucopus]|nr:hypothetical protein BYT27DRAFT_7220425 [Phlegmacium glaucopus]